MPKFGIEIECYNIHNIPTLVSELGWNVHGDGSIRGGYGAEIVSRPLEACDDSFRDVKAIMKALREANGRVNSSCGFHVHVEVPTTMFRDNNMGEFFETLVRRYYDLEDYLDTLVPMSRRADRNSYCLSTQHLFSDGVIQDFFSRNIDRETARNIACDLDRYHKINLNAFERHGTIEFRHFGGTLNGTKAVAWIKFCIAFMEVARLATLRTNRQPMTSAQWNNPYHGMVSARAISYLTARSSASASAVS